MQLNFVLFLCAITGLAIFVAAMLYVLQLLILLGKCYCSARQ